MTKYFVQYTDKSIKKTSKDNCKSLKKNPNVLGIWRAKPKYQF